MTKWGGKISNVSEAKLRAQFNDETDPKAIKRLVAAIEYKRGLSPEAIEEKYGISKHNIYTWLDRFEERDLGNALHDNPKPGRPPELSIGEWEQLQAVLNESPEEVGYDAEDWDSTLVQEYIKSAFEIAYSSRHVRRIMSYLD